jgi:hypothetical protein
VPHTQFHRPMGWQGRIFHRHVVVILILNERTIEIDAVERRCMQRSSGALVRSITALFGRSRHWYSCTLDLSHNSNDTVLERQVIPSWCTGEPANTRRLGLNKLGFTVPVQRFIKNGYSLYSAEARGSQTFVIVSSVVTTCWCLIPTAVTDPIAHTFALVRFFRPPSVRSVVCCLSCLPRCYSIRILNC